MSAPSTPAAHAFYFIFLCRLKLNPMVDLQSLCLFLVLASHKRGLLLIFSHLGIAKSGFFYVISHIFNPISMHLLVPVTVLHQSLLNFFKPNLSEQRGGGISHLLSLEVSLKERSRARISGVLPLSQTLEYTSAVFIVLSLTE